MADVVYLEYFIYLTDEALVTTLQAQRFTRIGGFGQPLVGEPGHPIMAPDDATIEWDAPVQLGDASAPVVPPPRLLSDYFTHEYSNYPRNRATFSIDKGGFWGWVQGLFGGGDTDYAWRGTFVYAGPPPGETATPGATLQPMPQRRWIDGFELPDRGESAPPALNPSGLGSRASRAASRHLGGFGWCLDQAAGERTHRPIDGGRPATEKLWERFYVRPHRFPTGGPVRIWIGKLTAAPASGMAISILPSGQIGIGNVNSIAVETLLATLPTALRVHQWSRIDVVWCNLGFGLPPAPAARFDVYLNGRLISDVVGISLQTTAGDPISMSVLGSNVPHTATIDFDDWIGADWPIGTEVRDIQTRDWGMGSRVALLGADAFAPDHGAWTGDYRSLRQRPSGDINPQALTSTTAGARLAVVTDASREIDLCPGGRGIVALMVALFASRAGTANGSLGYTRPGTAEVLTPITQTTILAWNSVYYLPSGLLEPISPLADLAIAHVKGGAVDSSSVQQLCAIAEVIGIFGPEDGLTPTPATSPTTPATGSVELVASIKADLVARGVSLSGGCGAFQITKRVAWALRANGCGLLEKLTGNRCEDRSTDSVIYQDGHLMDVLIDGGGANTPAWSDAGMVDHVARFRAPTDPGDPSTAPPWQSGHAYAVGDKVSHATVGYTCILAHTDPPQQPPNATYWVVTGAADQPPATLPPPTGLHNAPYPRSPWARGTVAPLSPVVIHAGTYVGNGSLTELPFRVPVCFVWIRPLTGSTGGAQWWSSEVAAHRGGIESFLPSFVEATMDPAFAGASAPQEAEQQCVVRITGAHVDLNAVGVTYSYVAISDPGTRFFLAGATHLNTSAIDYVQPLDNEGFTAEGLWAQHEVYGAGTTPRLGFKGIGHAATAMSTQLNGTAEVASAIGLSLGAFTLKPGFFTAGNPDAQISYLAFRRDDGSSDPGLPRVLQLATYTGDGSASRTVGLAPASGRRPMWAIVVPHNAVAPVMRDPAHTGTTSTQLSNIANASTGITGGGIDTLSVGSLLNSNGIVYDVWVLPGCDVAGGNNGWGVACENVPVEPRVPGGPGWPPVPPIETPPPVEPPGGGGGGGGTEGGGFTPPTDFGAQCVDASTTIINQALSRIGVSKRVGDIVAELSEEAEVARLHYTDDVAATLRDFPWPFATRYAQLGRVAGTARVPVNGDWQYAFRVPPNMLFARRLVRRQGAGRLWDPHPIDFRLGSDDVGGLLYTNHSEPILIDPLLPPIPDLLPDVTVELEYTLRLSCAASQGDALFRRALVWRHAASLAPVLSKDAKKATFCHQMYALTLGTAQTASAAEQEQPPAGPADWIAGRE